MLVYSLPTYLVLYVVFIVVLEVTIQFYLAAVLLLVYRHTAYFIAIDGYNGFKFCPSLLETVAVHAHTRNFRDLSLFTPGSLDKNFPRFFTH
jgi:hypothetical protein